MCVDTPDHIRLKIAFCACGQYYPDCDLKEACNHITLHSSSHHRWTWLHSKFREVIEEHTVMNQFITRPELHDYNKEE